MFPKIENMEFANQANVNKPTPIPHGTISDNTYTPQGEKLQ